MNPHPKWKQDRCRWCAAGVPLRGGFRSGHNLVDAPECTAPEPEAYIIVLEARLTNIRKELAIIQTTGHIKHREDVAEVCYDWCPACALERALQELPTPSPLPPHTE